MGIILSFLFLGIALFIGYVVWRGDTIPIGKIGLVTFLNSRTRRAFNEGFYVRHIGTTIELLDVKDHVVPLALEDVGCGDGFKVVVKGAMVRYRLGQIIPIGSGGRFRTSLMSLFRRIVPYTLTSAAAEFLSTQDSVTGLFPVKAQEAVNTFCATKSHADVLGYHVISFVEGMIAEAKVPEHKPNTMVQGVRKDLQTAVINALTEEFSSSAVEIVSFSIQDFDPDEISKQHIEAAIAQIREIQVQKLQTLAEVQRTEVIAVAAVRFAKENPGYNLQDFYALMRTLDNSQIGAEKLGVIGQILENYRDTLKPQTTPPAKAEEQAA